MFQKGPRKEGDSSKSRHEPKPGPTPTPPPVFSRKIKALPDRSRQHQSATFITHERRIAAKSLIIHTAVSHCLKRTPQSDCHAAPQYGNAARTCKHTQLVHVGQHEALSRPCCL